MTVWLGLVVALAAQVGADSPTPLPADTLVVCPAEFREALAPWVALRTAQGRRLAFCDQRNTPQQIADVVQQVARQGRLRWIVLVGDAPTAGPGELAAAPSVPVWYQPARVISRWGPDREIATDNSYADLDGDQMPDVAIGRLTASTPDELSHIVQKILAYEAAPQQGDWRKRIHFVAGVGGFGTLADSAIQMTTRKFLTELIPSSYSTTMTYASWQSPFCPDPRRFHEVTIDRLNEGSLFWVYMGHGQRSALDRVQVPGRSFHIMDVRDVSKLNCQEGRPIALMLACYTGAFDADRGCLGEEMLRSPGGPVATICSTRLTMPYAMAVMGQGLLNEYFVERRETLGELVLHAKRSSLHDDLPSDDPRAAMRGVLDSMASLLMPGAKPEVLRAERLEHAALFHILGDPLLTLRYPQRIEVEAETTATAGTTFPLKIRAPFAGTLQVELLCRRDACKTPFAGRRGFEASDASLAAYHADYLQANDACWHRALHMTDMGELSTTLDIPRDAWGPCVVRVHATSPAGEALGACEVFVNR